MFINTRSFVAFIILALGIGGSFWIARSREDTSNFASIMSVADSAKNLNQFAVLENLPSKTSPFGDGSQINLTNDVVSKYTAEILKNNKKGIGKNSQLAIPNEDALNKIMRDQFADGIPIRYFESKDIKTSGDNSKDAVLAYLKNIQNVYQNNINSKNNIGFLPAIAEYVSNQNSDKLQTYLSLVSKQIDGLLSATAPSDLLDIHLRIVNAWQKRLALGTAILQSDDDPMKAAVAIQEISGSVDEENNLLLSLQEKLKKFLN